MEKSKLLLGSKVFIDTDKGTEVLRVKKYRGGGKVSVINPDGDIVAAELKTLEDEYTLLRPHALICFYIVKLQEVEDVMVAFYRREEIDNNDEIPYGVCRQHITDLFANSLAKNMNYFGVSVTKDNLPENVDMRSVLSCNELVAQQAIAVYMDDTLKDILSFLPHRIHDHMNAVLQSLFRDHLELKEQQIKGFYSDKKMYDWRREHANDITCEGYFRRLDLLLQYNNFMYDFRSGFGIKPLLIDIDSTEPVHPDVKWELTAEHQKVLSIVLNRNITGSLIVRYADDVDLKMLDNARTDKNDYVLVCDKNEKLFVVAYTYNGPSIYQQWEEENVKDIFESVNFIKDKYSV